MEPKQYLPTLSIEALRDLKREMDDAMEELVEMTRPPGGPSKLMWSVPRKYFVPDPETLYPFPSPELIEKAAPIFFEPESLSAHPPGDERSMLITKIISTDQLFQFIRREFLPERFYY